MTTAVYNRQSIGQNAGVFSVSPIDVRIESEATPEEISRFLITLASFISTRREVAPDVTEDRVEWDASDYYRNKYGDEYAFGGALGFERSYLGARADFNHIF